MTQMMIRPATDADMFEVMRIRNSGREFMTHYTAAITPEEQVHWWFSPMRQAADIWMAEIEGENVGFCMIRTMDNGYKYGTLAVLPEYQGQGIGTALYAHMVQQVDELWIDVQNTNIASYTAAMKAGFEVYSVNMADKVITLVHRA